MCSLKFYLYQIRIRDASHLSLFIELTILIPNLTFIHLELFMPGPKSLKSMHSNIEKRVNNSPLIVKAKM